MAKRIITAFAEAGDRAAMPDVPAGTDSNYQTGYPSQYEEDPVVNPATAKFVERDKSNQLYNDITANIKEWQEHTYPAFITAAVNGGVPFAYAKNSIVTLSGVDFTSIVDGNEDVPPSAKWSLLSTNEIETKLSPLTVAIMTADTRFSTDDIGKSVPTTKDDTSGNGGGSTYDIIAGISTDNGRNIRAHDTAAISFIQRPPTSKYKFNFTVPIPTDFEKLQDAVDFYKAATFADGFGMKVEIEKEHLLLGGIGVISGDCSHITITSADFEPFVATASQTLFTLAKAYVIGNHEIHVFINGVVTYAFDETSTTSITLDSGATVDDDVEIFYSVKLDPSFVGVDTSSVPAGIVTGATDAPLLFTFNATRPILDCSINMGNLYGTGDMNAAGGVCVTYPGAGVVNAGFRGIQNTGISASLYLADYSGANGSGTRQQQASLTTARSAVFDDCCKTSDDAAVYVSRTSILEFRGGSGQRSGASGAIFRRSRGNCDEANFNDAADKAMEVESKSDVSWANGFGLRSLSSSLRCTAGSYLYAVGVESSTTSAAKNIDVDGGSTIVIADSNIIEGSSGEAQAILESNVTYLNAFDTAGMLFFAGNVSNGTFKIASNSDGISQRFADGRMITWTAFKSVNTGTVAPNAFSSQLTLPTQPDTFVSVSAMFMEVIGRTSAGGGGSRVCITNHNRPTLLTGNAWRIKNEAQQLDGASTILNIESVNVVITAYGTWK